MPSAISIAHLNKSFGKKVAVKDVSIEIPEGALYGFIGPNGAGKTTTIRMVMSIIFPDSGDLSVLGRASAVESKDRIGYLPEERGVYKKMKVGSFLKHMAKLKGMKGPEVERKVKEWLVRVELADCYKKKCEELSKGMQQKVQFIASIIHDPDLVILDEPFSGLDPVNMRLLRDLILELHKAGKTVVFSTHVMHQAETLCDHIIMINKGRKVLDSSMSEIRAQFDPHTLLVEPLDDTDAHDAISAVSGVTSVSRSDAAWEVSVNVDADATQIMRDIVMKVPIKGIEVRRPTLEDVFIEIVQRESQGVADEEALRAELRGEASAVEDDSVQTAEQTA